MSSEKTNIAKFLDDSGRIEQLPVPNKTKLPVLDYLAEKFDEGQIYSEKEVNGLINVWHTFGDYFMLRRLLVDYKFLEQTSNGAKYWLVKKEDRKEGDINGAKVRLEGGSHPYRELQKEWTHFGSENFIIEILENLEYDNEESIAEDLALIQMIWEDKLAKENMEFYKK